MIVTDTFTTLSITEETMVLVNAFADEPEPTLDLQTFDRPRDDRNWEILEEYLGLPY